MMQMLAARDGVVPRHHYIIAWACEDGHEEVRWTGKVGRCWYCGGAGTNYYSKVK